MRMRLRVGLLTVLAFTGHPHFWSGGRLTSCDVSGVCVAGSL